MIELGDMYSLKLTGKDDILKSGRFVNFVCIVFVEGVIC